MVAGHLTYVCLVVLSALIPAGCGTLPDGRRWGRDAFSPIDFDRVSRAAHDAFFNVNTLVPLAGAAVFAIDDFDERVSDWAVKRTPVYGSRGSARDASDDIKTALAVETFITALATASGDLSDEWIVSKAKGGVVEFAAISVADGTTDLLKSATGRTRPDESDDDSFPSGHATSAFSYATLSNRNVDSIHMPHALRTPIKVGNLLLASGVGWARVEAEKHYPSDVLAGAALGHFMTAFIHDAFMNLPEDRDVDFAVFPVEGGAGMVLSLRF
jgi:hypothetical protein